MYRDSKDYHESTKGRKYERDMRWGDLVLKEIGLQVSMVKKREKRRLIVKKFSCFRTLRLFALRRGVFS